MKRQNSSRSSQKGKGAASSRRKGKVKARNASPKSKPATGRATNRRTADEISRRSRTRPEQKARARAEGSQGKRSSRSPTSHSNNAGIGRNWREENINEGRYGRFDEMHYGRGQGPVSSRAYEDERYLRDHGGDRGYAEDRYDRDIHVDNRRRSPGSQPRRFINQDHYYERRGERGYGGYDSDRYSSERGRTPR
jgi:hypothetical protein